MTNSYRMVALASWIATGGVVYLLPEVFWIIVPISIVAALAAFAIPNLYFGLFPFVLVLGDGYLFTGNLVIQPSDAILLAATGSAWWRSTALCPTPKASFNTRDGIWSLWFAVCLMAFLIGWLALPTADWGDQLSIYFSRWNALRIGRGIAWSAVFFVTSRYCCSCSARSVAAFAVGMQSTLLVVGAIVVVERWLFEGLSDFSREFRATGPFSSMHIGGQHLDAFLTLSMPFAFFQFRERTRWGKAFTLLLVLLAVYAALSTMSRATLAAILAMIIYLTLAHLTPEKNRSRDRRRWTGAIYAMISLFVVGLAVIAAWKADAIRNRFSFLRSDWQTRVSHWTNSIRDSGDSWQSLFIGRGMGTFPSLESGRQDKLFPPLTWRPTESGLVRMEPEWPIYLHQWIPSLGDRPCICKIRARVTGGDAKIAILICKQALLMSYDCRENHAELSGSQGGMWQEFTLTLPSPTMPRPASRFKLGGNDYRPTVFSLYHASGQGGVEISNVSLEKAGNSTERLRNGDFENGSSHWFFSSDDHLLWHSKNVLVHLLVEQGILGLAAFLAILWWWARSHWRSLRRSTNSLASVLVASVVGTLGVAMFDSLLDTPLLASIFLIVTCLDSDGLSTRSLFLAAEKADSSKP